MVERAFAGQVRLTRLQVVNWGTFSGYKSLPISPQGVLFTGPSGSGKSSLIDAHSLVLLPTTDQRFNASADLTARGSKQSTRNTAAYVRGAWSETADEFDQSQVRYLRAGRPTWSAVAATYDDGLGQVTTAVVVRWFPGPETDGASLRSMYHLHDGDLDLTVLNEWAERGFDTAWFKRAYPPVCRTADQTTYLRELRARVRLGNSHHALALLGKAKAMKNVGDLNLFIRDNMLDEPETFEAARRMLKQFQPLNDAHHTAERAYHQARTLEPLPQLWATYQESRTNRHLAESVLGEPVDTYLRGVHVQVLRSEIEEIDQKIAELDEKWQRQRADAQAASEVYQRLERQFQTEGAPLAELNAQVPAAEQAVQHARRAYAAYRELVEDGLRISPPSDEHEFEALRARLADIRESAVFAIPAAEDARNRAWRDYSTAATDHDVTQTELENLRKSKNNVPAAETSRRDRIAAGAGVPATDLPYAAELIDIAVGEERWRPAAEKVVRSFALRLLVPERHKDAVRQFIDANDMQAIVDYSIVTGVSSHRPSPRPGTLASKLTVDLEHPAGAWLAVQITNRFEHVCVETARDLEPHRLAVTVRGTVKAANNHYRKDDRPEVGRRSNFILGANTAAKIKALEDDLELLRKQRDEAYQNADISAKALKALESEAEAASKLAEYKSWSEIDESGAQRRVDAINEHIESLKSANLNLTALERSRDEARTAWEGKITAAGITKRDIEEAGKRQETLIELFEAEQRKPHHISDPVHRDFLDTVYAAIDHPAGHDDMARTRQAFHKELAQRRRDADVARATAEDKIKVAVDAFNQRWPDVAPDISGDIDRSGQDYVALYEDIVQRRLHEAMGRFRRIISEDMVPSVAFLQRTIDKASAQIRERVDMVNKALSRAEFNTGTFLKIAYRSSPSEEAKIFRGQVDELMRSAPAARGNDRESLAQFQRVQQLMTFFTTDTLEARRWRDSVLDVRNAFTFYAREVDHDGATQATHSNTAVNSGGEQEKLVAFCLAAALSYNLADETSQGAPRFAPLMLDEAFSKSDEDFAAQALSVFGEFGFQLIMAAPIRMSGIVEPFIGQAILVEKRITADGARSNAASATFGELAVHRSAELDGAPGANA